MAHPHPARMRVRRLLRLPLLRVQVQVRQMLWRLLPGKNHCLLKRQHCPCAPALAPFASQPRHSAPARRLLRAGPDADGQLTETAAGPRSSRPQLPCPARLAVRVACHAKLHHLQARVHRGSWHHHPGQPSLLLCDSVGCSVQHRDRVPERRRPMLCGKQARDPQRCHGHRPLLVCTHLVLVRLRRRPLARAAAGSPGAPAALPDAGCVSARVRCGPQCSWSSGPSRCPRCRDAARRLCLRLPGSMVACSLSRTLTCDAQFCPAMSWAQRHLHTALRRG